MTRIGVAVWLALTAGCGGGGEDSAAVPAPVPVAVGAEEAAPAEPEAPEPAAEASTSVPGEAPASRPLGEGPVEMDWWASVRAPDGSERRWDLDTERFAAEVAGWRCGVGAASASQRLQIVGGRTRRAAEGARVLVCERGSDRRTATARCAYADEGEGPVPDVQPAILEIGDESTPHVVTVGCEIVALGTRPNATRDATRQRACTNRSSWRSSFRCSPPEKDQTW